MNGLNGIAINSMPRELNVHRLTTARFPITASTAFSSVLAAWATPTSAA
jgi:hypothetical protein